MLRTRAIGGTVALGHDYKKLTPRARYNLSTTRTTNQNPVHMIVVTVFVLLVLTVPWVRCVSPYVVNNTLG